MWVGAVARFTTKAKNHFFLNLSLRCSKNNNFRLAQIALFPDFRALWGARYIHAGEIYKMKRPQKSHLEFDCPAHIVLCSPIFKLPQKPHTPQHGRFGQRQV